MIRPGTLHWDGTESLPFCEDDGGRAAAGYRGRAGDCVTRAVAIASGRPYGEVYEALSGGQRTQRKTARARSRSARDGVSTSRKWFKETMRQWGFEWVPTMRVGQGCTTHLLKGELPEQGRLVVSVSKHYTAVIDGVIHDTHDPTRATIWFDAGGNRMTHRCVYGYWRLR